ncbi:MAG: hypothetical protein QNJ29_09930 [Rhizobiaceae bacterium]|nr:hypothetical protein [Rhizobiaceae bacterium]
MVENVTPLPRGRLVKLDTPEALSEVVANRLSRDLASTVFTERAPIPNAKEMQKIALDLSKAYFAFEHDCLVKKPPSERQFEKKLKKLRKALEEINAHIEDESQAAYLVSLRLHEKHQQTFGNPSYLFSEAQGALKSIQEIQLYRRKDRLHLKNERSSRPDLIGVDPITILIGRDIPRLFNQHFPNNSFGARDTVSGKLYGAGYEFVRVAATALSIGPAEGFSYERIKQARSQMRSQDQG